MKQLSERRRCARCRRLFFPDPRSRHPQLFCSKSACRAASKAESQRKWAAKPENQGYWRGEERLRKVREWRARNPSYWKRTGGRHRHGTLQEQKRPENTSLMKQRSAVDGPPLQEQKWTHASVHQVLTSEKYIGNNVRHRTSFKLKKKHIVNPPDKWIRANAVYEGIVDAEVFAKAQEIILARSQKVTDEEMLRAVPERQPRGYFVRVRGQPRRWLTTASFKAGRNSCVWHERARSLKRQPRSNKNWVFSPVDKWLTPGLH